MSANRRDRGVLSNRFGLKSGRRSKRTYALEMLESRTLLAYVFTYNGTDAATATGGAAVDSLIISPIGGLLEHSVDGGAFNDLWSGLTVPAANTQTVTINVSTGDGSSVQLGGVGPGGGGPASLLFAGFQVNAPANTSDTLLTDDSGGTSLTPATYTIHTATSPTVSGPGISVSQGSIPFGGGNTLMGSPSNGDIYNVSSVFGGEPFTIVTGGATTTSTVNVGSGGTLSSIGAPLAISNPSGGPTTININDASDTTSSTATLDDLSGNANAPFEVAGLSPAPIEYGAGVTALNVNGGTSGASTGVTYAINNTQIGTTTTISGGPNQNFYNLSNASETNGLDNLPGPVVVDASATSFLDVVTLDDSDADFNDNYTITDTTVSRVVFGGLTYNDNIGTLTLLAENNLGVDGNNIIDINNTADFVTTNVFGQGGVDTINVNGTGSFGTLNVTTGDDAGSTVNVVANNEPVNIVGNANNTVNIGSTGGAGTMAAIQGPISVTNPPALTALNFHDENDTTGQTWTLDNDDSVPSGYVAVTGSATTSYNPIDLFSLTVNGGSGGNTFTVNNTSAFYVTTLNTGTGNDTTTVSDTGDNALNIHGQAGLDTVTLGSDPALGMQGLAGTINVDNLLGFTALTLDDSQDTTGQTALLFNDGTNGQVTGLSPATINYVDNDVSSLTVNGGSGGNTFTVDGTIDNPFSAPALTTLNTGVGDDSTFVEATNAIGPLTINGQAGQDTVSISFFGSVANILGAVLISNSFGFTDITVDASADAVSHNFTLSSSGPDSTLVGLAPATITYVTGDASSLTLNTSDFGTQVMNIDMSGGNPIPYTDTPGLTWNAGADSTSGLGTHTLNIFGTLPTGPFASETHNANDPAVFPQVGQYGSIAFDNGQGLFNSLTSLWYTGLQPINDTTPATLYTFNDFADDQSFTATSGSVTDPSGTFDTVQFANTPATPPPTFETTNVANKTNIVFNTEPAIPGVPTLGITSVVNIPTASTGLASLTFNTPTPDENITSFLNEPPGVVTSFNGSASPDITNVAGVGVPSGTVLFLNGGGSTNTLNYDAGGLVPSVTAGLLPGEVLITIPGFGIVDAINYQVINITDVSPVVITPGPAVTINTVEGFNYVNAIVGTFTTSIPFFPGGPPGVPASDFVASIDWGDPSPDPDAGTITQDASNPSIYYVTGTHTFDENGTFTVNSTLGFTGGSFTAPVNGVPITFTFGPAGPTPGTPATANVIQGSLAVSAFPIVGTEGMPIGPIPVATFIDAGGAAPIGDYSAGVEITFPDGNFEVFAATIAQNGNANQYTVTADQFTLPEEGTYQVTVLVTDSAGATPITVSGSSTAVIADAPLTPGISALLTGNTGVPTPSILIGNFTDGNLGASQSDFTGTIDWGDGSPNSVATFQRTIPGFFNVFGNHTYAKAGVYTVTANVLDVGGSATTVTASFTITDLPVTGATASFTAVEGQNTGPFVLATFDDPNTLATVSDVRATLAIGGWGDTSPTTAGVGLTIVQVGVDPTDGDPIFDVIGNHTYAEETPAGLPNTLSVIITTAGGAVTTLTSPPGGGVTVLDAKLTGTTGNEISGIEGTSTGTVLLGTFYDNNQGATVADFTTPPGSVVVNWGDGSAPQTLAASNLTAIGTPEGVTWEISASHTYTAAGTYAYTITVTDDGGAATVVSGSAIIGAAALIAGAPTLLTANTGIALPDDTVVATFTDGNTFASASSFIATIDWGDGSPRTTGLVVATATPGLFDVEGGHTYAKPGVFTTKVTVTDSAGAQVTIVGTATVTDLALIGSTDDFTAVEGKNTGLFVLATFTDPNTLATVADVNAVLAIGGWGDTTPTVAGVGLVVQQTGVTPLTAATDPGDPIFEVLGSHTYAEETPAGLPDTLSVIITTLGGVSTTLTSPPGGGVTVLDAQLSSSNGTEITGVEGLTTGTVLLGTFTDANQGSTVADFTVAPGSTVVNWGDGSAAQTLTAANLAAVGSPDGVIYTVSTSHIYKEEGTYAYTVTVTDDGGAVTIFSGSAIVADAPLSPSATQPVVATKEATIYPVPVFSPPLFSGPVASFTDANPGPPTGSSTIADFTATIDWGDGTPMTAGTISQPGGAGTAYIVSGMHTYAASGVTTGTGTSGTYPIQVFIVDTGGSRLTVDNTATVADVSIPLSGQLNPASDSGLSTGTPNTTNVVRPDFFGTSAPLSTVTLSATLQAPGSTPVVIGQVEAGSDGSWNIQSDIPLADGHYTITATAIDQFGETTVTTPPSPVVINPNLLIDTHGPVVTGLFFNRLNGQIDYTIQDPGPAPSGVWVSSLLDSSNYQLVKVHPQKNFAGEWVVTNVTATPDPTLPDAYDVAVTINNGLIIKGGFYVFTIRDSSNGNSSVQDLAENHLDGVFYGTFPSGNGINGSDFVAELQAYHSKVFAPQTVIGTANDANGGVGGPRINPVHSGVFVPVIPRGGAPIFSYPSGGAAAARSKGQAVAKDKHHASLLSHEASHVKHPKVVLSNNHPKGPSH
jgi:hypothetical protein